MKEDQMQKIAEIITADGLSITTQVNALAREWGVSTSPKEVKKEIKGPPSKASLKPSKSEDQLPRSKHKRGKK